MRAAFLAFVLSLFCFSYLDAQQIEIVGKVLGSNDGKPLEFAVVTLKDSAKAICGGAITGSDGSFQTEVHPGCVKTIHVKLIGYNELIREIKIKGNQRFDLGNLKMEPDTKLLKEFEVSAERDVFKTGIDKRIYYPDQDPAAAGGTAIDALKSIPGITIGADQSVQLRNQSPTIFVNGRPSLLTIDQLPTSEIERIEVITNPSSKYVADATGGILNIIMKRNLKPGYFGRLNTSIGTNNQVGFNSSFSVREKKFMIQISGGINSVTNFNNGLSSRVYNDSLSNPVLNFKLNNYNQTRKFNYNVSTNSDIRLGIRSVMRISYSFSPNYSEVNESQIFDYHDAADVYISSGFRTNLQENNWLTHSSHISFRRDSPKPGKVFSTDFTFISSSNRNNFNFDNYTLFQGFILPGDYQENRGSREADYGIFQIDYTSCDTLKTRIETGLRLAYKQSFSDFDVKIADNGQSTLQTDTTLSNSFRVDDFVGAAYFNISGEVGKWGWQTGLRFEDTYFLAEKLSTGESYSFIYPKNFKELDKAIFPSIYLSRKVGEKSVLQINYSRKIDRPGYMQLIPFITYADRQLVQIGNPVLSPSFLNIGEINSTFQAEKISLFSGLYFRYAQGAITHVIFPSANDPSVLISTYANGKNQYSGGFEGNIKYRISQKFITNLNTNIFFTDISLQRDSAFISNRGWSWNAKLSIQYLINSDWKIQLNGNYEAPRIIPQGNILPVQYFDISINWKSGDKTNFSLVCSDVLNSKRFGTRYESAFIVQETYRRWETRYVRLSFTWQFGEPGKSLFRSRNRGQREPGNNGTEMQEL
ncbi:MAG: outer membrane beta-barrel protein [Bacteroidia bacterium]